MVARTPALEPARMFTPQDGPAIVADAVYTLQAFERATGLRKDARKRLVSMGLPIRKVCGRSFILGADFIAFLSKTPNAGYDGI